MALPRGPCGAGSTGSFSPVVAGLWPPRGLVSGVNQVASGNPFELPCHLRYRLLTLPDHSQTVQPRKPARQPGPQWGMRKALSAMLRLGSTAAAGVGARHCDPRRSVACAAAAVARVGATRALPAAAALPWHPRRSLHTAGKGGGAALPAPPTCDPGSRGSVRARSAPPYGAPLGQHNIDEMLKKIAVDQLAAEPAQYASGAAGYCFRVHGRHLATCTRRQHACTAGAYGFMQMHACMQLAPAVHNAAPRSPAHAWPGEGVLDSIVKVYCVYSRRCGCCLLVTATHRLLSLLPPALHS